jgi:NitT/TauT family transport system substrate-binding protein
MRIFFIVVLLLSHFSQLAKANDLLRVGTTLWPGYEPIHLAESMGFFKDHNIRPVDYSSTSEVLRAFKNRTLEVAALTLDEVVSLQEINVPIKIILVCDISDGADVIIAKPEIGSVLELKGKRVAVESTAVGAYVLSRALQLNQLNLSDIKIINMGVDSNISSVKNDRADAYVTYEPIRTKLLNMGLKEIFNSKQLPGEIVDVLVVHESFYLSRKKQLKILVNAWFQALKKMKQEPSQSYQFIAERMKISREEVADSYLGLSLPSLDENRKMLAGESPSLKLTIDKLVELMYETNLIGRKLDLINLTTSEFIPTK